MRNKLLFGGLCALLLAAAARAAEPTVADSIAALTSGQEAARIKAIDQLGQKGAKAAEAVPALAKLLKDKSALVRAHAADALGKIGAAAKPAAPALAAAVADPDPAVRRQALEALAQIRPGPKIGVPLFIKVMEDADATVRNRALHALADAGPQAVPFLRAALKNEKAAYWACLVLNQIGPEAKDAVPDLVQLLADKRPEVRREVILTLAEIGEAAAAAVPQIAKTLDDEFDRLPATFALGQIGKATADAEATIRKNVESTDQVLGTVSIWTLARLHPEDKALVREATEKLCEGLKSKEERVRAACARGLAALKPGPDILLPVMEKALEGADESVVREALSALASLGPAAVPKLIDALKHEGTRPYVVYILGEQGAAAKPAVEALINLLDDKNPAVQHEVPMALGKIGPDAKAAVPALAKALQEHEGTVCYGIAYALGRIGRDAGEAAPALMKTLESKDESLSMLSAWALAQMHPLNDKLAAKVVAVLVRALAEPDAKFRRGAAEALKQLGPQAKSAVPALKKAMKDEDQSVREMSAQALKAIGG
jgi:HEAT repeat protein